ncbi:MAG: vanadium-dependent haloperoxidase [Chitinophagaceae bacterium]
MPSIENNETYCWTASANATMASMIRYFNSGLTAANLASIDSLENFYNEKINIQTSATDFIRSQAFGRSVATAIYTWSKSDSFNPTNTGYVAPVFDGAWVPTPPAMISPPASPYVSNARPFLMANLTAVAPPFPFAYSEDTSSDFYKMEKEVYDVFQGLTTEQKNIALFWVDQGNGLGYTPDGHNMLFVSQAIEKTKVNLAIAAEAFAKSGIAERESNIACFRTKYKYNLLRPVTYIRKLIDPNWLSFIPTPPFPEYPAAHAFVTAAVVQAVTDLLGDHVSVTDHAYDFRGWTPRTYPSLFSAAEEAGISRLYGGIHYRVSISAGLNLGRDLGNMIGKIKLYDKQSNSNPNAY